MKINEFLKMTRDEWSIHKPDFHYTALNIRPRIVCADGFDVSIQASKTHYCSPRQDDGPYDKVEIGYPSDEVPEWMEFAEEAENPLSTVYGWVPVEIVDAVLEQHGGIANAVY